MKESFVFLAEGFEEIEAITPIDVLRRAGMPVKVISVGDDIVVSGANGVTVKADYIYRDGMVKDAEWLICPGGMPGATNLYEFEPLHELLRRQKESRDGRIAAICAAPGVVLGQLGLLEGEKATCYPGFQDLMKGADYTAAPVQVSGKFVTGNGPANALVWALTIVKETLGLDAAQNVANGMQLPTLDLKYVYPNK